MCLLTDDSYENNEKKIHQMGYQLEISGLPGQHSTTAPPHLLFLLPKKYKGRLWKSVKWIFKS